MKDYGQAFDFYFAEEPILDEKEECTFQQGCGCNIYGPSDACEIGKKLYRAASDDSAKLYREEISMQEADKTLAVWQEHLGA